MSAPGSPAGPEPSAAPGRAPAAPARDPEPSSPDEDDEDGRIGIFPSWRALYITVIVYTAGLIAILRVFTVLLDTSAQ